MLLQLGKETQPEKGEAAATAAGGDLHPKHTLLDAARKNSHLAAQIRCRKFSRHINIRRYFVRELVKAGFVKLIPLRTHKSYRDNPTLSPRNRIVTTRRSHQESTCARLHRPPPRHDGSNAVYTETFTLLMCFFALAKYFFS